MCSSICDQQYAKDVASCSLLELMKAYELVPRAKLQALIVLRFPSMLSKQLCALLCRMVIQTRGRQTKSHLLTRAGVLQGGPTSPKVFPVFMDSVLQITNERPYEAPSPLLFDDLLAVGNSSTHLQSLLDHSESWADENHMVWNIFKSCGIQLPTRALIKGNQLQLRSEALYLGFTVTKTAVRDTKILQRIFAARGLLFKLQRITWKWRTTTEQRRAFAKTFVLSITGYPLFLQPMTNELNGKASEVDTAILTFMLQTSVGTSQWNRGRKLVKILSLPTRRNRLRLKTISRFK